MKKSIQWFFILIWFTIGLSACGMEKQEDTMETVHKNGYTAQKLALEEGVQAEMLCTDGEKLYVIGKLGMQRVIFSFAQDGADLEKTELDGLENGSIQCFRKVEHGWLLLLEREGSYEIVTLDEDGSEKKCNKLDTEGKMAFYTLALTEEGEVYADGRKDGFFWFGNDGALKKMVKRKDDMAFGSILAENGKVFCVYDLYEKEMKVYEYTDEVFQSSRNGNYAEPLGYAAGIIPYGNGKLTECFQNSFDFYIYDCNNMYGYSIEAGQPEKILNWLDCDLNGTEINQALAFQNDGFALLEQGEDGTHVFFVYPSGEENQQQKVVTLAVVEEDINLKERVLDFNRKNEKIHITVKDYSQEQEPVQALHHDLISGNVPDIVNLYSMDARDYSGKGLLMDLTDFLKEDTEISQEDFLPNIIEACKIDGKIYFIPDSFYIRMLAGEHSVIQGRKKWNMKEFSELYQTLKKGEEVMAYYVDQEDMLEILCDSMLPSYLDMDTGMADFRQDSFRRILECAKSTEWNGNDDAFKIMEKIQNGTIPLIRFDMGGYRDYAFYKGILKNGEFIGFPTEKGSGFCAAVYGKQILSVTEKSSHKKAAFQFLKSFWTYEYQKSNMEYGYPVRMDVLEKKLEYESAEKSYIDEDGNAVSAAGGSTGMNGVSISYGAMTEEEQTAVWNMIKSVDRISLETSREQKIISMIGEEAAAYFSGDKSLEETMEIIQSRVELYMEERK